MNPNIFVLSMVPLKIILDVDECKYNNRCVNSKGCINQVGDFLCICQDGWTGKLCDQSKFFEILKNLELILERKFLDIELIDLFRHKRV